MFSKINVNGSSAHPMWAFLKEKQGGFLMNAIKWNFTKFVVDKVDNLFSKKEKKLISVLKLQRIEKATVCYIFKKFQTLLN